MRCVRAITPFKELILDGLRSAEGDEKVCCTCLCVYTRVHEPSWPGAPCRYADKCWLRDGLRSRRSSGKSRRKRTIIGAVASTRTGLTRDHRRNHMYGHACYPAVPQKRMAG